MLTTNTLQVTTSNTTIPARRFQHSTTHRQQTVEKQPYCHQSVHSYFTTIHHHVSTFHFRVIKANRILIKLNSDSHEFTCSLQISLTKLRLQAALATYSPTCITQSPTCIHTRHVVVVLATVIPSRLTTMQPM